MKKMLHIAGVTLALSLAWPLSAHAQMQENFIIIAEVDGQSISSYAVDDRVDLMIQMSGMKDSPQVRQKLRGSALQTLITEMIQTNDAKQWGIEVSDEEKERARASLEKQNNLPPGALQQSLEAKGIDYDDFLKQMYSQLLWQKIVARRIAPFVQVSGFEVEEALERLGADQNKEEVYLSEIVIAIENGDALTAKGTAEGLVEELRNGASFGDVAAQFSMSSTAQEGGAIGWIDVGTLSKDIQAAVAGAESNSVLDPLVGEEVVRILKVGNRRNAMDGIETKRKRVEDVLKRQKVDKESQRYMYDLRKKAFVDIRI